MACIVPSAPQAFVALPKNNSINLAWTAPSSSGTDSVTGYNLYSSTESSSGPWNQVFYNQNITSYILDAIGNQEYFLQVTAVSGCGESSASVAYTVPGLTYAPQNLTAVVASSEIYLSWSTIDNATGYKVYFGTSPTPSTLFATITSTNTVVTGLTNSTLYYFKVTVISSLGTEDTVNYSQITAEPTASTALSVALPTAPTNVSAVPIISSANNAQIVVNWSAPVYSGTSAITGYNIYISLAGVTPTLYTTVSSTTYTLTTTGLPISSGTLAIGTTYDITIAASNSSGLGLYSGQVSAVPYGAPSAPTNLTAIANVGNITLSWSASAGQGTITYSVYASNNSSGPFTTLVASGISGLTYTASGSYTFGSSGSSGFSGFSAEYFVIVASNTYGSSTASSVAYATACSVPGSIGSLIASQNCGSITLTWSAPTSILPITQYNIYSGSSIIGFTEPNILYVTIENTTATFGVAAVSACGTGAITHTGSSVGPLSLPSAPSGVTFTPSAPSVSQNMTVTWSASGSTGVTYTVYLAQSGVNMGAIVSGLNITTVTLSTTNWQIGALYTFQVVAVNTCGASTVASSTSFTLSATSAASGSYTPTPYVSTINPSLSMFPSRGVLKMWNFSANALEDLSPLFPGFSNSSSSSLTPLGWYGYQNVTSLTPNTETSGSITRSYLSIVPASVGDPIIYNSSFSTSVDSQTKLMVRLRINTPANHSTPSYFGASIRAAWADGTTDFDVNNSAWCSQPLTYVNGNYVTYVLTPPWSGTVGYLAIQIENLPSANRPTEIDIDYIAIVTDGPLITTNTIDSALTPIRVAVNGTQVQLWVGRNEFPIFNQNNFLSLATNNYSVSFGKLNVAEPQSKFAWGSFKFNTGSNYAPVSRSINDWQLQQRLPSTGGVQQIVEHLGTPWALTDAFQSYRFTDNIDDRTAKAFAYQPDTQTWERRIETLPRHTNKSGAVDGLAMVRPLGAASLNGTLLVSGQLENVVENV